MRSFLHFFWAALKNPLQVSTMFATGKTAVETLISSLPANPSGVVVELGVGTGAITGTLLKKIGNPQKYIGFELNEDMIEFAKERFPQIRFEKASAENFASYLEGRPLSAVVSSLPWTLMPQEAVTKTLDSIRDNLVPGGVFATYLTVHVLMTPAGRRLQEQLKERFASIETEVVIENLPPVKVLIARL